MSKKIIFGGVAVLVVFLGIVLILSKGDKSSDESPIIQDQAKTADVEVKPTMVVGEGSLNDLLKRGENLECSIVYNDKIDDEAVEGSYFTSQERMRGDFLVNEGEQQILSSMIIKDEVMYSWSEIDGDKFGMKVDLNELAKIKAEGKALDTREPVPLDDTVKYDCKPWNNVDGSIFEPPTDILFRDFSSLMNTGMEFGTIYEEENMDFEAMMKELNLE